MRERFGWTDTIFLMINGHEQEYDARFEITFEEYPAEPTSWGSDRGTEWEVSAKLIHWGHDKAPRDKAVILSGEDHVKQQEDYTADSWSPEDGENNDYEYWWQAEALAMAAE